MFIKDWKKEILTIPNLLSLFRLILIPVYITIYLNAKDAAYLAKDLKAKVCVPHHFWTFPLHNSELGDPMTAYRLFPDLAPDCKLQMLVPGEAFLCG